jgi:hypothetical protein
VRAPAVDVASRSSPHSYNMIIRMNTGLGGAIDGIPMIAAAVGHHMAAEVDVGVTVRGRHTKDTNSHARARGSGPAPAVISTC